MFKEDVTKETRIIRKRTGKDRKVSQGCGRTVPRFDYRYCAVGEGEGGEGEGEGS